MGTIIFSDIFLRYTDLSCSWHLSIDPGSLSRMPSSVWSTEGCVCVSADIHHGVRLLRGGVRHAGRIHAASPVAPVPFGQPEAWGSQQGGHSHSQNTQAAHECLPGVKRKATRQTGLSKWLINYLVHSSHHKSSSVLIDLWNAKSEKLNLVKKRKKKW